MFAFRVLSDGSNPPSMEAAAGDRLSEDAAPCCAPVDGSSTRNVEKMPRRKALQTDAGVPIKLDRCLLSSFTTLNGLQSSSDMEGMRREKLSGTKITISAQRLKPELHVPPLIETPRGRFPGVTVKPNVKHSKERRTTRASSARRLYGDRQQHVTHVTQQRFRSVGSLRASAIRSSCKFEGNLVGLFKI